VWMCSKDLVDTAFGLEELGQFGIGYQFSAIQFVAFSRFYQLCASKFAKPKFKSVQLEVVHSGAALF